MPTLGIPNVQGVYDATNGVPHAVLAAAQPFTLRDNATPIGDLFVIEEDSGDNIFDVDPVQMNYGEVGQRLFEWNHLTGAKGGMKYLPDNYTATVATGSQAALQWDSTFTSNIPGGAPFGNDTAPALCASVGEVIFLHQPLLLSTSLLFNQATVVTMNAAFNLGPIYTLVHQPTVRVGAIGGSRSCSQMNAVRAQARIGPNIAGNLTQTSVEYFYSLLQVDATVGTVSCTTYTTLAQKAPTLTAGGTIGTLNVIDIPNIPAAGITNIYGINSAMNNGFFLRHVGTAQSTHTGAITFGADVTMTAGDLLVTAGEIQFAAASDVRMSRPSVGVLRIEDTEGLDFDFDHTVANQVLVSTPSAAGLTFALGTLVFGADAGADPTAANWQALFNPPAKTITVGGDVARRLFSASGQLEIDAAASNLFTDIINEPSINTGASSGSAVDAGNVLIQTNVAFGTNRYGLLITSNPSGGTENAALCVRNGPALFQGTLVVPVETDGSRGAAGTAGRVIFNTTDGQLNIDDGTNWTLPDGTVT